MLLKPWASRRERACASVKLLAPGSTAPVVCGLSAGLWVTAGFDEPLLLFIGCVVEDWATADAVRADKTVRVAKPRRIKIFLLCSRCVGAQCATTATVPNARLGGRSYSCAGRAS